MSTVMTFRFTEIDGNARRKAIALQDNQNLN